MDFLYSGAFAHAVSTGAVALYQHLGPHHLLRPVFGLCWNALGFSNQLLALRHHSYPREIRNAQHLAGALQFLRWKELTEIPL